MLETVYAVKNNRKAKGILDEHDPRLVALKKWVRGLARKGKGTHTSQQANRCLAGPVTASEQHASRSDQALAPPAACASRWTTSSRSNPKVWR